MLVSSIPIVVLSFVVSQSTRMAMELTLAVGPSLYHATLPFVFIVVFASVL